MTRALTFAALLLAACATARPAPRAAGKIGQPVALTADDLGGNSVSIESDEGRVRVVDFWATWCEPCRDELPQLDALVKDLGARGLAVYAVSFDVDSAQIPVFLQQIPLSFPVLWDKGGDRLASAFLVNLLPTTFVVDRKGIIRFVHEGYDTGSGAEIRREVERLLEEPAAP